MGDLRSNQTYWLRQFVNNAWNSLTLPYAGHEIAAIRMWPLGMPRNAPSQLLYSGEALNIDLMEGGQAEWLLTSTPFTQYGHLYSINGQDGSQISRGQPVQWIPGFKGGFAFGATTPTILR